MKTKTKMKMKTKTKTKMEMKMSKPKVAQRRRLASKAGRTTFWACFNEFVFF